MSEPEEFPGALVAPQARGWTRRDAEAAPVEPSPHRVAPQSPTSGRRRGAEAGCAERRPTEAPARRSRERCRRSNRSPPTTDIRAFLQPGVPAELTACGAAPRLDADPAIRDFVGLAENPWDFTDPTAMPGFGPLTADDVSDRSPQAVGELGTRPLDGAQQPPQSRNSRKSATS